MATYAIGDIQGCLTELKSLIKLINFKPDCDRLWFVGDLVNRGPDSLETLRFIKSLRDSAITVLGNHDLHLLALAHGVGECKKHSSLYPILKAKDSDNLLSWLQTKPLAHYDKKLDVLMIHAGVPKSWTRKKCVKRAKEVQDFLMGPKDQQYFENMYGNKPKRWKKSLEGFDRLRYITNALTRIRFCYPNGKLDLKEAGKPDNAPYPLLPWFELHQDFDCAIVFGHWAALEGHLDFTNKVFGIDTGCVWGGKLTALRLDDYQIFSVAAKPSVKSKK